jgi:hypothetical protein
MTWITTMVLAASLPLLQPAALDLNDLAERKMAAGDDGGAVATLERALATSGRDFGPDHPITAMIMRNLALGCSRTGDLARAERLAAGSIAVLESRFGPADPILVPALNVMGESLIYEHRLTEARTVLERAVAVGADAGPHYATALQNLGAVFALGKDAESAARYYALAAQQRAMLRVPGRVELPPPSR